MISEHDRVILTTSIPELSLEAGDIGAVVHVYDAHAAYEVEFVRLTGETVSVVTVAADQVRPVTRSEIPHARELAFG